MQHLVYGIKYVFCHQILKKNTPLICGLVVNDKCNLQCRHCRVANRGIKDLSFEEAKTVFSDPYARMIFDPDHSIDEDRFVLLGLSSTLRILVVCHCYMEDDMVIRIISARKASKYEQKQYESFT